MLKDFTVANLLDLNETIAAELFEGKTYPWEVLPEISDFIMKLGPTLNPSEYECKDGNVWIAKSAKIAPTAYINGPAIIGKDAEVRHCAFIRGNVIVGEGAVVGNSTELKNAVLFNKVQVPHYNYVGDAVLGYKSHMGAGSICSNVKSDKKLVVVKDGDEKIETGLKKFGAMLGDYVEVGCGSVLNPGTVIGRNTNIYPLSPVRGCIPADSIYKNAAEIIITQPAASNDRLGYFLISEKIHQNEKDETTPSVICMQQDRDTEESKQREKLHPRCFPEVFKSTEGKISKKESKKNILFISIMPGV